jgi:hypothetical protein
MDEQPSPAPPLCAACSQTSDKHHPWKGPFTHNFQPAPPDTLEAEAQEWLKKRGTAWAFGLDECAKTLAEFARSRETVSQSSFDALKHHFWNMERRAESAEKQARTLEAALQNFVDEKNWSDEVGCLQWVGKRHAIEFAQSVLREIQTVGRAPNGAHQAEEHVESERLKHGQ